MFLHVCSNRTTPTPSVSGDGGSSKGGGDEEEDEYNPNVEDSDDDERTIAKEEDQVGTGLLIILDIFPASKGSGYAGI